MRIKPTVDPVVGPTDDTHWGQVLILPNAYGVIEVFDLDGAARDIGLRLLSTLSDQLAEPVVSLIDVETCVQRVVDPKLTSLIVLVPVGVVAYLVCKDSGAVYLKRDGRIARLLANTGSVSGKLVVGDTLLVMTKRFVETIGEAEIALIFDHEDPKTISEKLTVQLSRSESAAGAAGLVFGVRSLMPMEGEESVSMVPKKALAGRVGRMIHKTMPKATHFWHTVRDRARRKNSAILAIAIFSFILFIGSVLLGVKKQLRLRVDTQIVGAMIEAQHAFNEGVALLDLNSVKGRERLSQAKRILDPLAATVSAKTKTGRHIVALSKEVDSRLSLAMQVHRGEPQLFYDTGLLKKGAVASSVALVSERMALLDASGKTVFFLNLVSKNGQIVAGGEQFSGSRFVAMQGDKVYVLVADGIHMIRTEDKKTEPLIVKRDSEWGSIADLVAYGGNLYLLDLARGRIWKYVSTGAGFSERREYLNPDTLPDFTWATTMVIDGSVWLGTNEGKILRFTQGQEQTFLPKGVAPPLGRDLAVYTSDEASRVYILDRENKRVVMLEKDGTYLSQYVWEGAIKPTQFVVSEILKTIFLLYDGKVYNLELK